MIDNKKKALTHIVADQLGWDDDIYRDILRSYAGVSSAGDAKMSLAGFKRFMTHAEKCGFQGKTWKPVPSKERLLRKITAMTVDMGLTQAYVNAIAHRMFAVDSAAWCTADQLRRLVAALMYKKKKDERPTSACALHADRSNGEKG